MDSIPTNNTIGVLNYNMTLTPGCLETSFEIQNVSGDNIPLDTASREEVVMSHSEVIAKHLRLVVLPILVFFGTIGNGLSFCVLLRRRMRSKSVYLYLLVLSCSDSAVLIFSAFKSWIYEISGWELLHVSQGVCKMTSFITLVALYSSSWLIVLVTVDRSVAVWSPLRAASLCSLRHARMIAASLVVGVMVYNLHILWTFTLLHYDGRLFCIGNPDNPFMQYPFEVFKLVSYCFVPFSIVLALNCVIIYKIRATRRNTSMNRPYNCSGRVSPIRVTHAKITYMLLTVSFAWLMLTAPFSLLIFMGKVYESKIGRTICFLLMYTNHSINFLLYCVTGKKFRKELKELLSCRGLKQKALGNGVKTHRTDLPDVVGVPNDLFDDSIGQKLPISHDSLLNSLEHEAFPL